MPDSLPYFDLNAQPPSLNALAAAQKRLPSGAITPDLHEAAAFFARTQPWLGPSLTDIRDVALRHRFVALETDSGVDMRENAHSQLATFFVEAVRRGRVFDLGHMPDRRGLTTESGRAADLYGRGHIGHPFREPYVIFHTYELEWGREAALHLAIPTDEETREFCCVEFVPFRSRGDAVLMIGDIGVVHPRKNEPGFAGQVWPCKARDLAESLAAAPAAGVLGNQIAPVISALLLLSTDGVVVDRVSAPDKLNRARERSRKPPIPPHFRVSSLPYVTALRVGAARNGRAEPQGGTHASPVPHLRRGHERRLGDGRVIWVRDSMINFKGEGDLRRAFYALQQGETHG